MMANMKSKIGLILIIAVVLICIPITVPRFFGYEAYSITSGSMEPEIATGSVVYAKNVVPEEVAVGDVIVFYGGADGTAVTTHRVVDNDAGNGQFITKGDANAGNDMQPVPYGSLLGRVEKSIPMLGMIFPVLADAKGKVYLLCILIAGVILRVLGSRQE